MMFFEVEALLEPDPVDVAAVPVFRPSSSPVGAHAHATPQVTGGQVGLRAHAAAQIAVTSLRIIRETIFSVFLHCAIITEE